MHVRYPHDGAADDEEWLATVVVRHGGELDRGVMLSNPVQRFCRFPNPADAKAFAEELNATGRWQANI